MIQAMVVFLGSMILVKPKCSRHSMFVKRSDRVSEERMPSSKSTKTGKRQLKIYIALDLDSAGVCRFQPVVLLFSSKLGGHRRSVDQKLCAAPRLYVRDFVHGVTKTHQTGDVSCPPMTNCRPGTKSGSERNKAHLPLSR